MFKSSILSLWIKIRSHSTRFIKQWISERPPKLVPVSIRHLVKYILKQTAPHELDKVLSTRFYAEVTKRNRDTNELESLKIMQSAIQRYLKEKIIHSRASCSRGSFTTQKEIHRRITPAAPSSSFSKDNEKFQRQPQKKGRSSIIDSGEENRTLMHERPMKETDFVPTSEMLVCLLCFNEFSSHDIVLHTK